MAIYDSDDRIKRIQKEKLIKSQLLTRTVALMQEICLNLNLYDYFSMKIFKNKSPFLKLCLLSAIFFLFISKNLSAQTSLSGVVRDSLNNPIPFAYVYLSKTTIGAVTDKNGVYSLTVPEGGRYELIASCIGYKLNSQIVYSENKKQTINIILLEKVFILNEVTIKSKYRNRQKDYNQFVKSFIGETSNSQSCKILNPEDLRLFRDSKESILKGYSLKPLKIENKALGYNVIYDLVDFSYNIKTGIVRFSGYNYFQPLNGSVRSNKYWEGNRLATYYGSKMHFLRALFSDSLSREGYKIFECKFDSVSNKYLFVKSVNLNYIRFLNTRPFITLLYNDSLMISYTDNNPGLTAEQLAPQSITKGLFSDSLKRENYSIIKNYKDSSLSDLSGSKPILENDIKLSSNKNYVTLFYANPLMISFTDSHSELFSENPILQLDENIRVSTYILTSYKDEWAIPSAEKSPLNANEYRSIISFSDTLKLYNNGYYYEPYSISWAGAMALERIGDMLPLDFLPYREPDNKNDTIFEKPDVQIQDSVKAESALVAEKVYLHIDRDHYIPGDDIWFKAYVTDAFTNMPAPSPTNLHVELISSAAEIIQSRILRVEGGIANGDFHLPDSIAPGNYLIRAYTNYMRNFDNQFFFSKNIAVINPAYVSNSMSDTINHIENQLDITFFPEGGSLVDSISSVVAFKAVNALGNGCDISGKLFSSRGDLMTTFESNHLGMGSFTLEPVPGLTYYALVNGPGRDEIKASLPESFSTGATIRAVITHGKKLLVTINTNEKTLPLILNHDLDLSFSSRNLIKWITKIKITSLVNEYLISADDLPEGIIRITLSGYEGLPLCERLIYLQRTNDVLLNVSTDKKVYNPRELITTKISISGNTFLNDRAFLSLSATESLLTAKSSLWPTTITSWFLLESDVHGPVEEPSYYFDPSNENRFQDLDLLLLTQGWRDFKWKYDSTSSFGRESGFRLSGNVKRITGDKTIEGAKINLGLFSKSNQFLSTVTDSSGSFTFEGLDFTGKATAFVSSTGKNERMEGRIFMDSIYYEPAKIENLTSFSTELFLQPVSYISYIQEANIRMAIRKKYMLSDTINPGEVFITAKRVETPEEIKVRESRRIYGTPDKELIVTPSQENIAGNVFSFMSGRLPGVRIYQDPVKSDSVFITIRGQKSKNPNGGYSGAMVLLDGKEVNPADFSTLQMLTMNMIDRIDVLNASPLYGMKGANGVINIITRVGLRREPFGQATNATSIKIKGFDTPRFFYSPKYNNPGDEAYFPDIRTTIFWEPNITIDKLDNVTVKYYNADTPSTIRVVVEGITTSGIPVSAKTEYEVNK
jgi:hypothetical protein